MLLEHPLVVGQQQLEAQPEGQDEGEPQQSAEDQRRHDVLALGAEGDVEPGGAAPTEQTASGYTANVYLQHCDDYGMYLSGRCCCILAMSPMLGSERMYMVTRIAMTTKSQEDGLAGYTPLITPFCNHRRRNIFTRMFLKPQKHDARQERVRTGQDDKSSKHLRSNRNFGAANGTELRPAAQGVLII